MAIFNSLFSNPLVLVSSDEEEGPLDTVELDEGVPPHPANIARHKESASAMLTNFFM
jgi:hypothetical protein